MEANGGTGTGYYRTTGVGRRAKEKGEGGGIARLTDISVFQPLRVFL